MVSSCSSVSRLRLSEPFRRYGPKRPFWTVISTPSAGSTPTTRGRLRSCMASSNVIRSRVIVWNSDAVLGRGASSASACLSNSSSIEATSAKPAAASNRMSRLARRSSPRSSDRTASRYPEASRADSTTSAGEAAGPTAIRSARSTIARTPASPLPAIPSSSAPRIASNGVAPPSTAPARRSSVPLAMPVPGRPDSCFAPVQSSRPAARRRYARATLTSLRFHGTDMSRASGEPGLGRSGSLPRDTYGPNRPERATTTRPVSGSVPNSRSVGVFRNSSARATVSSSGGTSSGIEAVSSPNWT